MSNSTASAARQDPPAALASLVQGQAQESQVAEFFQGLEPVTSDLLIGEWDGFPIDTGHPGGERLKAMKWTGKAFRSVDDADPIVVLDEQGLRQVADAFGKASLRQILFRGKLSTAMVYDTKPIFDHFRLVDNNTVVGAMDAPKVSGSDSTFYFYLTRRA